MFKLAWCVNRPNLTGKRHLGFYNLYEFLRSLGR
jgi:hypothetical protein